MKTHLFFQTLNKDKDTYASVAGCIEMKEKLQKKAENFSNILGRDNP